MVVFLAIRHRWSTAPKEKKNNDVELDRSNGSMIRWVRPIPRPTEPHLLAAGIFISQARQNTTIISSAVQVTGRQPIL